MTTIERIPRVLLAGGGTGGHVYPAVAIADAIRSLAPRAAIAFAGTRERMEWEAVPRAGYAIHPISVSGFQRSMSLRNFTFPFKLMKGFAQSWALVRDFDPDVVVGTGGYVSGPVLLAASFRGRPIVIQEQNAYAGATNRMLARRAEQIHIAFPEASKYFPEGKTILSGNPTRRDLTEVDRLEGRQHYDVPDTASLLLVFGGSLGSAAINKAMEHHLQALLAVEDVYVIWQTGHRYYDQIRARVSEHARLRLLKYIDRMDLTYAAADLALCRAGAITCSELMVTGTPSVLVPSPNVAEDHQTKNALSMVNAGAAVLLPEPELEQRLSDQALVLLTDENRRKQMSDNARSIARPDAAEQIARRVLALTGWNEL